MSRVINPNGVGKERTQLIKAVLISIRELSMQNDANEATRDLVAFIIICLQDIHETIERTVVPWEKRDYWVKADRFRMEWSWANTYANELEQALMDSDWAQIAAAIPKIAGKLGKYKIPKTNRLGKPWDGSYKLLIEMQKE